MIRLLDRCKQSTTDTGTGDLTLGSTPTGYRALTSVYAAGERFLYVVEGDGTSEWEIGYGYLSASDLVREQPISGSAATPVAFSSGTKYVFVAHEGKLSAAEHIRLFGDGSDGDFSASAGTTVLTQNMNYRNLTLSGTALIVTNGWKIRVQGVCDLSNYIGGGGTRAITSEGATGGAGAAAGTAGTVSTLTGANTVGRAGAGGAGGAGGTAAGSAGSAASNLAVSNGGPGGLSGAGGAGSGGAGGAAAVGGSVSAFTRFGLEPLMRENAGVVSHIMGGAGGGGGGGGGGDGTAGGGGGAGGNGGGVLDFAAAVLKVSSSTIAGVLSAVGGFGGDGGTPAAGNRGGGGAGAGAGGGYAHIKVGTLIGSKSGGITAAGGGGGTGGALAGTGANGAGGAGGYGGTIHYFNLTAGARTEVIGSAGGAAVGRTGGAGGACSGDIA